MKNLTALLLTMSLLPACATTHQTNRLSMAASGFAIGAAVGFTRPEEPPKNAVMYGSLIGLGAAIASEFIFDDERENARIKKESEKLKRENEILKQDSQPKLQGEGESLFTAPIPKDVRKLVSPGNWKRFKIDRWLRDDENENLWVRQTEMFEISPPAANN